MNLLLHKMGPHRRSSGVCLPDEGGSLLIRREVLRRLVHSLSG